MPNRHSIAPEFWKRKLAAYLHDPPSKALEIRTHGDRSDTAFRQAGFSDTEIGDYFRHADHTAAAMDRLPFPNSSAGLQCAFDGIRNGFLHPLSGNKLTFHAEFKSVEQGFEVESTVQPELSDDSLSRLPDDGARWRAKFFAHWRLWPKHAAEKDYRLAFLPADTRIPDHSIWSHMQVVSALAGCRSSNDVFQPAFLKFQLGPVQEFIAAARSIRDLWSGSYLLSWLMAKGLKALSARVGPDAVIYPNLRGQPLFDLHWRDDLWSKVRIGSRSIWESLGWNNQELLTPNLPNVFLAVVPAAEAAELAQVVKNAIENEWGDIAKAVWTQCENAGLTEDESGLSKRERRDRFDAQVNRFLSLSWQSTPWPESLKETLNLAKPFSKEMPIQQARDRATSVIAMAQELMPIEHRDGRYYIGGESGPLDQLNNAGLGWSVIMALNSWQLDAVRQTRAFEASNSGGWNIGSFNNKDALTGREEAVAGGKKWGDTARKLTRGPWSSLFKHDDWLSAPTLIKRVWHFAYLNVESWNLKTSSEDFQMPDTRSIAQHQPFGRDDDPESLSAMESDSSERYFAVLALDGDKIGEWISGKLTPKFSSQLADYPDGSGNTGFGSKPYFERTNFGTFLDQQRPLSPSYHLQFSEALSNFALRCVRPIVESHKGRLIYAGGDDVVALLPSDTALACAQSLRTAFQGGPIPHPSGDGMLFSSPSPGFLWSEPNDTHTHRAKDNQGRPIPFLVPGPAADCSVGIAIAHFKAPLQDVVRSAQAAEKRAKRNPDHGGLNRSAVAVTLMKRSGEIIEWGTKWAGGLELYHGLADALGAGQLSSKFPHRFAELLEVYTTTNTPMVAQTKSLQWIPNFPAEGIVRREFEHCVSRQRGPKFTDDPGLTSKLRTALDKYLDSLTGQSNSSSEGILRSVIGLCQTVAFAHRTKAEDSKNENSPKGNE